MQTKLCGACGKKIPLNELPSQKEKKADGTEYYRKCVPCRPCRVKLSRAWRIANPKRFGEYQRKYQKAHREKVNQRARKLYWSNPEKYRALARKRQAGYRARLKAV